MVDISSMRGLNSATKNDNLKGGIAIMRKEKKHLVLDADVTDGLQPFLDKVGMSLSAYVRFVLAQTYAEFTGLGKVLDLGKSLADVTIGDIVKAAQEIDKVIQADRMIDLTPGMTEEEIAFHGKK